MAGATAAHYHRHAIRPHVFGPFEDLLIASASHPAMLAFLDNAGSRAPTASPASSPGARRDREHGAGDAGASHAGGSMAATRRPTCRRWPCC
jgi:hypothetical protein